MKKRKRYSNELPGSDDRPESPGLAEALRALDLPKRPPGPDDARRATKVPMTRAQREALRLSNESRRRLEADNLTFGEWVEKGCP